MKKIRGITLGGLQQKIFNLMLIFILALVAVYTAVSVFAQRTLTDVVLETNEEQQSSITAISQETMRAVLETSMARTTALQAYIADDLFSDVRSDVLTLQAFAEELFAHSELFAEHPVAPPSAADDGTITAMLVHEEGVEPSDSPTLGLVGNMSEIMKAMYEASDKLSSVFVGTADGNMVLVNDRPGTFVGPDGSPLPLDIRHRPWYAQAEAAGELIFTGVELDAYTDALMLECAAPVYHKGELVAVVSADIYLDSIRDYVNATSADGGFLCVVDQNGRVLFSPRTEGVFRAELSDSAADLRSGGNPALADFVTRSLKERTPLELIAVDGKEYYLTGAPMETLGWTVLTGVEKETTDQPTAAMLSNYEQINDGAVQTFEKGVKRATYTTLLATLIVILLALVGALVLAGRVVKPLELMTRRVRALGGDDLQFHMEKAYRTGDEIEVLAESFAMLSGKTVRYIAEVEKVTAEKERIGTELALATRIQADMLPNIFPAFPERPEFDIYASMEPAKEVGGDFYDFFLIDETHLGLVIADVSGKGVPAALFMMIAKILVQNYAMTGRSPAEVLRSVNDQICSNNREEMFVTVWFGILDTATGKITAANAGHEYPAVMHADGRFELLKDKHGFVIGGMEGVRYREYELQLEPGAKLFLYTDGVPEATSAGKELFGTERMLRALNEDTSSEPEAVLGQVRRAVDRFVGDAEQFDDLTMLCLKYRGARPPARDES